MANRTEKPELVDMRCPKCRQQLAGHDISGVVAQRCTGCEGIWFEDRAVHDHIGKALESVGKPAVLAELRDVKSRRTEMPCPRCAPVTLEAVRPFGIEIERCLRCRGVFLDHGELEVVAARAKLDPADTASVVHTPLRPAGESSLLSTAVDGAVSIVEIVWGLLDVF